MTHSHHIHGRRNLIRSRRHPQPPHPRAVVASPGRALAGDALVSVRLPAVARCAHVPQLYQRVVAEAGHPVPERAAVLVVVLPFLRVAALLAGPGGASKTWARASSSARRSTFRLRANGASVVLFAASACATPHRSRRMCRGAMLASRSRHAAAALLPRMPAE